MFITQREQYVCIETSYHFENVRNDNSIALFEISALPRPTLRRLRRGSGNLNQYQMMTIRFINELIYAQDLFYSRKNYKRPELQQEPHRTFADEATLLDAMFHGNHYLFFLFIDFVAEISLVCVVY